MKLGNVLIFGDSYSTFKGGIPAGFACYYPCFDVTEQKHTWWQQLIDQTQSALLLNSSWSGSTICNTGYDRADFTYCSFISRLDRLIEEGFFEKNTVDTVLVFGGTNDAWADSPLGSIQTKKWTKNDLYSVLPAACYLLDRLKKVAQNAKIVVIVNSEISPAVTDGLKEVGALYEATVVALNTVEKECGHPNFAGMTQIKDEILAGMQE